jgi:hypothetical protein
MNGIGVQRDIVDLVDDAALILLAQHAFARHPLEAADDRVLDLREILHGLGGVENDVGADAVGSEAPDLARLLGIEAVLLELRVPAYA